MRHKPNAAVYSGAYISERMPFDVLSAVLERPSADSILRMLTHMSLMRDPCAPVHVPDNVLDALPPDPDIDSLEQQRERLKTGAYRIQGTDVEAEVRSLAAAIGSARSRRRNIVSEEYRAEYFRSRPTQDIERQNRGEEEEKYIEPVIQHQIPERMQLTDLICTRFEDLEPQDAVLHRIRAASLMLSLCGCREIPRRYQLPVALPAGPLVKVESPDIEPSSPVLPLICGKTQCPFCIGEGRMGSFCRVAKMRDHVERAHLKGRDPEATWVCDHPVCKSQGLVLKHLQHFKIHVLTVHGIGLRE
jgi:Protein of unknown function (DUF3435)